MINGIQTDLISVRDRGLQYGDGCFETVRIHAGTPVLLDLHLQRLQATCKTLRMQFNDGELLVELSRFLALCPPDGVLKIIMTRGTGGRGYTVNGAISPNRILMYTEYSEDNDLTAVQGACVVVSPFPLSNNTSLAGLKHLNRLDQVMSSFALGDAVNEAICLDQQSQVIEGTKSNLFLVVGNQALTPDLGTAGVKGVMRDYLLQRFEGASLSVAIKPVSIKELLAASELFLCNSVFGVWPVRKLTENANVHRWPTGPLTRQAMQYHHDLLAAADQTAG